MAKSRAQRKAEKRRREQQAARQGTGGASQQQDDQRDRAVDDPEGEAQQDTQLGVSGEVREAEAAAQTGQAPDPAPSEPEAPAPSRADVGRPDAADAGAAPAPADETRDQRKARKEREKEARRKQRAKELQQGTPKAPEAESRRRTGVRGFLASCIAELRRVQWPDRDTLVQASAVTLIFVVVMAAYLGGLDAVFNLLIKQIL